MQLRAGRMSIGVIHAVVPDASLRGRSLAGQPSLTRAGRRGTASQLALDVHVHPLAGGSERSDLRGRSVRLLACVLYAATWLVPSEMLEHC